MAGMKTESGRMDDGRSLAAKEATGSSAVGQLAVLKTQLLSLKAKAQAGIAAGTHTQDDVDEVQDVITGLATQIQSLLT